jgi:OTT_1508-like deaminase
MGGFLVDSRKIAVSKPESMPSFYSQISSTISSSNLLTMIHTLDAVSLPACFNCFQYLLAHPGTFALPASHNKIYLTWRPPDTLEETISVSIASRIREAITSKMNHALRAELRRQIDSRCARRARQHDSLTGTSSSIQGAILHPLQDISEDGTDSVAGKHLFPQSISLVAQSSLRSTLKPHLADPHHRRFSSRIGYQ